jgi:hypothetical protein
LRVGDGHDLAAGVSPVSRKMSVPRPCAGAQHANAHATPIGHAAG